MNPAPLDLPLWADLLASALLIVGGAFALIASIGLHRYTDFYMRLHAPTLATTLGVGCVLLASIVVHVARGELGMPELLIPVFLFVTAPVSSNLIAQAALHLRVASSARPPGSMPHD